jgi:hypothetical protein
MTATTSLTCAAHCMGHAPPSHIGHPVARMVEDEVGKPPHQDVPWEKSNLDSGKTRGSGDDGYDAACRRSTGVEANSVRKSAYTFNVPAGIGAKSFASE